MKKKVLFVIAALETGGAEKSLINLLNLFDYSRYDVDLLLFKKEGAFLEQVPDEVNLIYGPKQLHALYGQLKPKTLFEYGICVRAACDRVVGQYYKRIKYRNTRGLATQQRWHRVYKNMIPVMYAEYDVAVAYMHMEPLYFVADKVRAKKKIGWVHIDYKELDCNRDIDMKQFERFQSIVTISNECVNSLLMAYPMMKEKFVNLPNLTSALLLRKLSENYVPVEYSKESSVFKLLSIGRLSYQKGFDFAIDAAKILKEKGIHFCWYVIGQGDLKRELEMQIERNGVSDCFKLLGVRSNPYPYIKYADIIVQPSRFEGKSVVLDEVKILTRPIITTNYPTVRDQIQDGKEGVIVNMNPEAIANEICALCEDECVRNRLIQYLQKNDYDNAQGIEKYYRLLEE